MSALVIGLLTFLATAGKRILDYFSAQAQLERRKLAEARREAEERVEAERLGSTLKRIGAEQPPVGKDLLDRLNRKDQP